MLQNKRHGFVRVKENQEWAKSEGLPRAWQSVWNPFCRRRCVAAGGGHRTPTRPKSGVCARGRACGTIYVSRYRPCLLSSIRRCGGGAAGTRLRVCAFCRALAKLRSVHFRGAPVQDRTRSGYTAVGPGLRSSGHAGGKGGLGRVIHLWSMRLQDHGWDLCTFGFGAINRLQLRFSFRSSAAAPPTWPNSRLAKDFDCQSRMGRLRECTMSKGCPII
jgi:hypothetical protein